MADERVGIEFVAKDMQDFIAGLSKVDSGATQMNRVLDASVTNLNALERAAKQVAIDKLSGDIELQKKKLAILNDELEVTKQKYGDGSTQAKRAQLAIDTLNHSITTNETKLGNANQALATYDQKQAAAAQESQRLATETRQTSNIVDTLGKEAEQTADQLANGGKRGAAGIDEISQSASRGHSAFNAFEQIAIGALRRIGEMAINLGLDLARAIGSFAIDSIGIAADYESTLNRFSAVTGSAIKDAGFSIEQFDALFLKLGADTQFSAQQSADAAVALAKGGVPIAAIMGDATEATLNLAAAGELELAPAADIVAKQLGVWADRGITATQIADLLSQAANASTVDVDELALGLANVGGSAKVAGVDFDDLVTTMALIAPGFSSAADAGTSLKTFFTRLIPTTTAAKDAMVDLGLVTEDGASVFYDAQGQFLGMENASAKLYEATKDLSEEQKMMYFNTIFGSDAVRAAAIISEQGEQGYLGMAAAMDGAGTALEQATERNKGFNFALEQMKGSLETIQIIFGRMLLPVLTSFLDTAVIPLLNSILDLGNAISSAGVGSTEFYTALSGIGQQITNLVSIFIPSTDGISVAWGSMLVNVVDTTIAMLPSVIDQFGNLAMNMMNWIGTAVPPFIAGFGEAIRKIGDKVIDALPDVLASLATIAQNMINWVATTAPVWAASLAKFGLDMVSWIVSKLPDVLSALGDVATNMINWVLESLPTWGANLAELGKKLIDWVIDALPGLAHNLGEAAGTIIAWIAQTVVDVVPKLAELGYKFLSWVVTDVVPHIPEYIFKFRDAVLNAIGEFIDGLLLGEKLQALADKFVSWINPTADDIPSKLEAVWKAISNAIADVLETLGSKSAELGKGLIDGIIKGLGNVSKRIIDAMYQPIADGIDWVKQQFGINSPADETIYEVGIPLGEGIVVGLKIALASVGETMTEPIDAGTSMAANAAGDGADRIVRQMQNIFEASFRKLQTTLMDLMSRIGGGTVDSAIDAIETKAPEVTAATQTIADAVSDINNDFIDVGSETGTAITDGMTFSIEQNAAGFQEVMLDTIQDVGSASRVAAGESGNAIGAGMMERMRTAMIATKDALDQAMTFLANGMVDEAKMTLDKASGRIADATSGLAGAAGSTAPAFTDAGSDVASAMIDEITYIENATRNTLFEITDILDSGTPAAAAAGGGLARSLVGSLLGELGGAAGGAQSIFDAVVSSASAAASRARSIIAGVNVNAPSMIEVGVGAGGGGSTTNNNYTFNATYNSQAPAPSSTIGIMTAMAGV